MSARAGGIGQRERTPKAVKQRTPGPGRVSTSKYLVQRSGENVRAWRASRLLLDQIRSIVQIGERGSVDTNFGIHIVNGRGKNAEENQYLRISSRNDCGKTRSTVLHQ